MKSASSGPGPEIAERALSLTAGTSPDAVGQLVTMAEGRRPPLEAAGTLLVARLHRRSDDFAATRALSAVNAALSRVGWDMPSPPTRRPRFWERRSPSDAVDGKSVVEST